MRPDDVSYQWRRVRDLVLLSALEDRSELGTIDYDRWYPKVLAVMDTKQLAELLNTNEQIVRDLVP